MSIEMNAKAEAALRDPSTQAVQIEMTPEKKEHFRRVAGLVVDLLRRETKGPVEGYMILHFVMNGFEENYGIRGGFAIGNEAKEV